MEKLLATFCKKYLQKTGQLSVLKKPILESVVKKDMQVQPENRIYLPTEIIVDGKVVKKK